MRSESLRGDAATDQESLFGAGELESVVQRADGVSEERGQWTHVPPRGAGGQSRHRQANGRGSRVPALRAQEALIWDWPGGASRDFQPPTYLTTYTTELDLRVDSD